jgi:hypothetical protein
VRVIVEVLLLFRMRLQEQHVTFKKSGIKFGLWMIFTVAIGVFLGLPLGVMTTIV